MSLQAATATREISPRTPMFLVGYPHVPRTSTGIHDPLLASALHLKNGTQQLILVAVDILFIDPQTAREIRAAIERRTGVPAGNILITCTHTHSGPNTIDMLSFQPDPVVPLPDPEYMAFFKQAIIDAACEPAGRLEDAELAVTAAPIEGCGCNRLSPDGPRDPEVGLIVVRRRKDHALLALSMTYAMHPTVLHEDSTLISGDFPGLARLALARILGPGVGLLYHMGTSGNQSPRHHVRGTTFAEAERLGEILATAVGQRVAALRDADFSADVPLAAAATQLALPRRTFPPLATAQAALERARATYARLQSEGAGHGPVRTAECAVFGAEEAVFLSQCQENGKLRAVQEQYTPIEITALRIGEAFVVGLPGEVFVEYGLEIKARSGRPTLVISLANGETQGYIVTPEAADQGSYEANNSLFEPSAGSLMCEAALGLLPRLFA